MLNFNIGKCTEKIFILQHEYSIPELLENIINIYSFLPSDPLNIVS